MRRAGKDPAAKRFRMIRKVSHVWRATRDFDRDFWLHMGVAKIFAAAADMVVDAWGLDENRQRVQRTVAAFRKAPR
jgi:hypothetical protein